MPEELVKEIPITPSEDINSALTLKSILGCFGKIALVIVSLACIWMLPMLMNGQVKVAQNTEELMSIAAEPDLYYGN